MPPPKTLSQTPPEIVQVTEEDAETPDVKERARSSRPVVCNMVTHARRSAQRGGEKGDMVVRCRAVHPASHGVVVRIR